MELTVSTAPFITAGREGIRPRGKQPHRRRTEFVEGTTFAARAQSMVNFERFRIAAGSEGDASSCRRRKPKSWKLLCPGFAEETAGTASQGGNGQGVGVGTSAANSGEVDKALVRLARALLGESASAEAETG